jgi:hypothetical protein
LVNFGFRGYSFSLYFIFYFLSMIFIPLALEGVCWNDSLGVITNHASYVRHSIQIFVIVFRVLYLFATKPLSSFCYCFHLIQHKQVTSGGAANTTQLSTVFFLVDNPGSPLFEAVFLTRKSPVRCTEAASQAHGSHQLGAFARKSLF